MPTADAPGRGLIHAPTENGTFRQLELLKRSQPARRRAREFFVEGVKSIDRARETGWPVRSLVYAAGTPLSAWAQRTLSALPSAQRIALSKPLMARLSDKNVPSELVAIVDMPPDNSQRIGLSRAGLAVVLDRPSSPGNLGSIVRSCHALGADGLLVTGHGTDLYNPLTVRASMGSLFSLPVVRLGSHREVGRWVGDVASSRQASGKAHTPRIQVVGASVDALLPPDAVDLTQPTVLVLGNEAEGLADGYRELCDVLVRIPMRPDTDSINIACAAAVLLYEVDRQRRRARGHRDVREVRPGHPKKRR
ncbi:MAG TPA: TrmH family RNA methyltransferase [Chloroflexota bacterium]|nr:TrmH family RNA methyltransferase [Chloroflexota bacterium]